jgi:hypothetical protein
VDGYDISAQFQSIAIATALPRGHNIEDEGVGVPLRSTLNFVGAGVTVTDGGGKTIVTISNTADAYRSTSTRLGQRTTSGSSWQSVSGSTLALVMDSSQYIKVEFSCNLECDSNTLCPVGFGYLVDGAFIDGATASTTTGVMYTETTSAITASPRNLAISHKSETKLAPGTHNISLLWASGGGVPIRMGRNMLGCSLRYSEAPEQQNAGAAATVSGQANYGSQTNANLRLLSCSVLPCMAQSSEDFDIYTATGTGPGQWRNSRLGTGP